jgi:4-amino-4-deoxy-L-arabinose transferase-like glycosyltransferase
MTPRPERARFYTLALIVLVMLFLGIGARWIWLYRHGLALDIDEAGYLCISLIDYYGLHFGGVRGWIAAIEMPSIQAPLTTALSSLVYTVVGPHAIAGFAVPLVAAAGCIAGTYALGCSLRSPRAGLLAAVLVASCPAIVIYARSYQFSMPATCVTTFALVAMLRSQRFRSIGWSLAFGVCLGLMPLARTMTLAFIPGLGAAAFIVVVVDPANRPRRLLMLSGAFILGILVAATWLWRNGLLVAQYLLNFGYGARALEYGPQSSKLGLDAWLSTAQTFAHEVYAPHFLLILLGVLALPAIALREVARCGVWPTARRILSAPILPVTVFAAEAILVLTTSSNKGSGFFAPVVPALLLLSLWAFQRLGGSRPARAAVSALVAAVALVATVPLLDLRTPFAPEWVANLPVLGGVTVTDGRSTLQRDEARAGYGSQNAAEPIDDMTSRAWINLSGWTADMLNQRFGIHATVMFGFRNELYNVNTLNLMQLLRIDSAFGVRQVEPGVTGESVTGYLGWIRTEGADACALLTSDRVSGDFRPAINRAFMEEAARQSNFIPALHWPAPDGQIITMWTRPTLPHGCQ